MIAACTRQHDKREAMRVLGGARRAGRSHLRYHGADLGIGFPTVRDHADDGQCGPPAPVVSNGATGLFVGGQTDPINRLVGGFDRSLHDVVVAGGMDPAAAAQLVGYLQSKLEVFRRA